MSKKLYIPTTTLNFNSILASESISPPVFYTKRKFGYKTLEKIELNCFDNSLLGFDRFPIFDIYDTERDNYPMIIEFECLIEDLQPIKTIDNVLVYQFSNTIYLNPFSTKIYFLSEEKRKFTLLSSERSASTKMVSLYNSNDCFKVANDAIPQFNFSKDVLREIKDVDFDKILGKSIELDGQINRAKGFLYSFLIGANKSLSKELVTIKRATREIGNIISAVIHSPDKSISHQQKENLSIFCKEFGNSYRIVDNSEQIIIDKIKLFAEENYLGDNTIKVLDTFNVLEQVKRDFIRKYKLQEPFNIENFLNYEWNENTFGRLNQSVLNLEEKYLKQHPKIKLSEKIHLANLKITSFSTERADFYILLINDFITYCDTDESQVNIALKAGRMLNRMYEEKNEDWNESKTREYINSLLANMQGKGDFSVSYHTNLLLQSFAVFVLNKNEYEKIEKSLIDNLISNFSYSFGLWGAFWGFANIPKTLTNELFLSDNLEYISEVYKFIFKQIHGIELEGKLDGKPQKEIISIPSKINKQIENAVSKPASSMSSLTQELLQFKEYTSRDENIKREIITKLNEKEIYSLVDWDNKKADSIVWVNSKGQKKLMSAIKKTIKEYKPKIKVKSVGIQNLNSLFKYDSTGVFLEDYEFLSNNQEFVKIVSKEKNWQKDLEWFISEYNNPQSKYYGVGSEKGASAKDNKTVIQKFIFLKKGIYKDTEPLLKSLYLMNE